MEIRQENGSDVIRPVINSCHEYLGSQSAGMSGSKCPTSRALPHIA